MKNKTKKTVKKSKKGLGMPYQPISRGRSLQVDTPDSMGAEITKALQFLKQRLGNIDEFVRQKLNYPSLESLYKAFAAEQIDALALGIYNIENKNKSLIVGDQTGVGKGRVAAGFIRFGVANGLKPIFITEKPNLFSDIYRDLIDIGAEDGSQLLKIKQDEKKRRINYKPYSELSEEEKIEYGSEADYFAFQEENEFESVITYKKNENYNLKKGNHIVPFIINAKSSKSEIKNADGDVLYQAPDAETQKAALDRGKIPSGFNAVLLTYSQIQSGNKIVGDGIVLSPKASLIQQLAENNLVILDESHNASGESARGKALQEILEPANVIFLSATFAKRPDNMPIYAMKTSMQEANLDSEGLSTAINKGGVALQEVVSAQLVGQGEMIRRERTFDGIEVNYISLEENGGEDVGLKDKLEKEYQSAYCTKENAKLDRQRADAVTSVIRAIIDFQETHINTQIKTLDKIAAASQGEVEIRKGTEKAGVDNTSYFSKIFNIINQLLFAIKAEAVADRAIMRLKQGKKPVIAFSNTMGSFIESLYEDTADSKVSTGSRINADFTTVLEKGLSGILRYTEKLGNGERIYRTFDVEELGPEAVMDYRKIEKMIRETSSGIVISPIDLIKQKIEKAGFKVSEVTGRKSYVELSKNGNRYDGRIMARTPENANDAFRKFNDNEVDVLMINQSGSTGASAHAIPTKKVSREQVKQRVMIVLQAELDINTEVQKRGRINRTGQIIKPIYDYITSSIPAEKRLMMMLQKKLKSLDANTASNQKNSEAILKSEDFLNKYGDAIVREFLVENKKINKRLGDPLNLLKSKEDSGKAPVVENAAQKVTGRVAVLKSSEQENFYKEILEQYRSFVEMKLEAGEYDLEVEIVDLKSKTLSQRVLIDGKGGSSPFGTSTFEEKCEVKETKKPFKADELKLIIEKELNGLSVAQYAKELSERSRLSLLAMYEERKVEIEEDYKKQIQNIANRKDIKKLKGEDKQKAIMEVRQELEIAQQDSIKLEADRLNNSFLYLRDKIFSYFEIGLPIQLPDNRERPEDGYTYGVFIGFVINDKKSNAYTPSNIKLRFAIASSKRTRTYSLSGEGRQWVESIKAASSGYNPGINSMLTKWQAEIMKNVSDREIRYIITGNLLQAFGDETLLEYRMKLIQFTTDTGEVRKGILMPDYYKKPMTGKWGQEIQSISMSVIPIGKAYNVIKSLGYRDSIQTNGGIIISKSGSDFLFAVPASKQKGGAIYLDKNLISLLKRPDFIKQGNAFKGEVSSENLEEFLIVLQKKHNASVRVADSVLKQVGYDFNENKVDDLIKSVVRNSAAKQQLIALRPKLERL